VLHGKGAEGTRQSEYETKSNHHPPGKTLAWGPDASLSYMYSPPVFLLQVGCRWKARKGSINALRPTPAPLLLQCSRKAMGLPVASLFMALALVHITACQPTTAAQDALQV
jgi:hypothetical protein